MPFIPHTPDDVKQMLDLLDISDIEQLFDEVPKSIPQAKLSHITMGLNELEITQLMSNRAPNLQSGSCFIGAGAYEHHIPAAIWQIVSRGEFYTAYTPYQAEASQGSLQLIYEYQTMMANLTGMDVSNASLYDGASALAEAVLMAVRLKRSKAKRVLVPTCLHPHYRAVLQTILKHQDIHLEDLAYDAEQGRINVEQLSRIDAADLAAVIIPQPNFFGSIEDVDVLTDKAHELDAYVIAVVNPTALALLKAPGQWGEQGADIVCGEGQPLGIPLASGGPYFGFMTCKKAYVRQLPGRIVGKTEDASGRVGYTLTLQAREQHIRRAKATSNICTNQGLMVVAATIYMSLMGFAGLKQVALASHTRARELFALCSRIDGVTPVFAAPVFHEFVLRLPTDVDDLLDRMADNGLQGGYSLKAAYPDLGDALLICVTETKTAQDLERYYQLLTKCVVGQ